MANTLPDYTEKVEAAVALYWQVRQSQAEGSRDAGVINTGLRAEVTGGRHLDALELLLVEVLVDAGMPATVLEVKRRPVPGYFRRDKSWDIVVTVQDRVLAIVELKSIVGENPGQNFNNRTDEALGQAMDIWKAVERGIIDSPLRPWLGYFMLIEDNEAWNRVSAGRRAVWPADPAFNETSASDRAAIFFDRMVRERLLDAACVVMANRTTGEVRYKRDSLGFQSFAAAMFGRCLQFKATNPDLRWGSD
jgi:Restriction endonuclease XhoI